MKGRRHLQRRQAPANALRTGCIRPVPAMYKCHTGRRTKRQPGDDLTATNSSTTAGANIV